MPGSEAVISKTSKGPSKSQKTAEPVQCQLSLNPLSSYHHHHHRAPAAGQGVERELNQGFSCYKSPPHSRPRAAADKQERQRVTKRDWLFVLRGAGARLPPLPLLLLLLLLLRELVLVQRSNDFIKVRMPNARGERGTTNKLDDYLSNLNKPLLFPELRSYSIST
ncbi:hypothetical protein F2P81_004121 [Scophthalmus maximus]|uniref:Uncharacterized protein n=1 Tax=Scophthalmus maximus TaxID=52904 RepID=A0A6A4THS8_SCOMX|nr:hypothetical protein F2P81_004121 [Scophthalmus maximus]